MVFGLNFPVTDLGSEAANPHVLWSDHDAVLNNQLSCSVGGKLFTIEYFLLAFVKHDAWNEWGEGNAVRIPIKIMQPPVELYCQQPVMQTPQGWSPIVQPELNMI